MSVIQIMVMIIIVTILVTVILGVASYAAYWLRRGRRPAAPVEVGKGPRYFYRYTQEAEDDSGTVDQALDNETPTSTVHGEEAAAVGDRTNGRSGS
jgi:hypothetical protein